MKLATFMSAHGEPAVGSVDTLTNTVLDLQALHADLFGKPHAQLADMLALIEGGEQALDLARSLVAKGAGSPHAYALTLVRLLAPVPVPPQIRDFSSFEKHVRGAPAGMMVLKARLKGETPPDLKSIKITPPDVYFQQPVYYISNRFNVIGHDADVEWPDYCDYLDFELEFGAFIAATGKNISAANAGRYIFGYSLFNDFSARDRQSREMEGFMGPTKGKSFDTGNAIGPWIVTKDEMPEVGIRNAGVYVNGEAWAESTTANMLHSFEDMIAYVSRSETLHAGEFFGTGTIGGCCGLEMDRWLKPGDVVELRIDGLGVLRNRAVRRA